MTRMPRWSRSNPLALAVLVCLYERPMHPYEVAQTLRQRAKQESVRLNYGSLYAVVESLEMKGFMKAAQAAGLPRLFELETEYEEQQLISELKFVNGLVEEISSGTLEE